MVVVVDADIGVEEAEVEYSWNRDSQIKKTTQRSKKPQQHTRKVGPDECLRCDMKGHWTRICRTPDHLVKLFQESLKEKENNKEVNLVL